MPQQGEYQRRPLLESGDDFSSFDDDELQGAAKLRRKRQRVRACAWMTCGVLVIALIGVILFFATKSVGGSTTPGGHSSPTLGKYKHAAVASDVHQCSQIGRDILEKQGGNAVDAAISTLLCMGLADPQSMGIGGGFFMTIYNRTTGQSHTIDARETAPSKATTDMFYNGTSSTNGGLAIAVPGEIRGYEMAHSHYGTLAWKDLFQPAIQMANTGFTVPQSLAQALQDFQEDHPGVNLKHKYPQFGKTYIDPKTGDLYKEGDILKYPELCQTLEILANEGPNAFYINGSLHKNILDDIGQDNSGAIITADDLLNYAPRHEDALMATLSNQDKIFAPTAPSGGPILMFILNILDGYNMSAADLSSTEGKVKVYHRITEAFKFAYAKRTALGDNLFTDVAKLLANLTSSSYATEIRDMIWDNQTHPTAYYGPTYSNKTTTSTAHLSIVDQFGNAVSVTSTVNTRFGSKVFGKKTGIIFNNEMDDFATSDKPNDFGLYPSPANKILPGKRPLSSMCPAIFVDRDGDVKLVLGAAGGSRITTATAYVAAHVLWLGDNIEEAINELRLHHQLLPQTLSYEQDTEHVWDKAVISGLKALGHNLTTVSLGKSIVQGIHRNDGYIYANSDYRKGGLPDGF